MKKTTAEDILTEFVKGDIKRDYNKQDRAYYTCSIDTALRAMRKFAKIKANEAVSDIISSLPDI